ncbi:MAG: thioredoxin domain-containing protein, partial [Lewinella sp.]|nr:thioredoxin domain-containing protein [Lewinella sp.]
MLRPLPLLAIAAFLWLAGCNRDQTGTGTHTNALIHESSPYLLQHAHNPVDWYPWGDEALTLARANNKLLLISIGYAACHWCHVMEEETFQDTAVARLMNEHFISIKVDREERPDIDDVYMTACQLISRQGCGWPLNAIALPDGRPVWVGTYLPRADWVRLLEFYQEEYQAQPGQLLTYADQIANNLAPELPEIPGQATPFTPALLEGYARGLLAGRDTRFGGQDGAPKFPMPDNYRLLLAYHHYTGDATALEAVTTTLNHLAAGGIFDQLAGGFARYSTDIGWKLPHFEKMLYDNGQLVRLFAEAYAATGTERYREVVDETLAFVANRLTSPEGGFYSSLDADSEGEEGRYYVWTKAEIDSLLPAEQAALVNRLFDILPGGNWEDGKNVLHGVTDLASATNRLDMDLPEAKAAWHAARATLLQARQQRPQPRLDDKILTGWNALMLQGYLAAYEATGTEDYLATARRNADFLLK